MKRESKRRIAIYEGRPKVPRFLADRRLVKARRNRASTLEAFLKEWLPRLRIDDALTPLTRLETIQSPFGSHCLFRQRCGRQRVSRGWLRVDLDAEGNVFGFSNRCACDRTVQRSRTHLDARRSVSVSQAIDRSRRFLGLSSKRSETLADPVLVVVSQSGRLRRCWKVKLASSHPFGKWNLYIDASDASLFEQESLLHYADPVGRVFVPNPMVALNRANLKATAAIDPSAYREVRLSNLNGNGHLDGRWVTTSATSRRLRRPSGDFRVNRGQRGFEEVMAYYHIDAAQQYLQSIKVRNRTEFTTRVNVNGSPGHESFYDSNTKLITFATGGVPDGQDAEIILHEYAHALHDAIIPGFGRDTISIHLAEGFADYFAATFFENEKSAAFRPGIASWDSVGDNASGTPPFLRRLDNAQKFRLSSRRLTEFWSSCLWGLRDMFGRRKGDLLAIGMLYYVPPQASFFDAVQGVLAANLAVDEGNDKAAIIAYFVKRGLLVR